MTRLLLTVATILALAPMTAHAQRRTATPPPESIECWNDSVCALAVDDWTLFRVGDVVTVTGTIRNHTPAIIHGVTARAYTLDDDGQWRPVTPADLLPGATGTFTATVSAGGGNRAWAVGIAMAGMAGAIVTPPTASVTPVPPTAETPTVTVTPTATETVTPTPTRSPLVVARGWMPYALR